jgi:Rrf2 family transcriptional regulator, nitric oxide-sensitive transcriptional repressor
MRLTQWSDYSLRVLMYCAASAGRSQPVTITEIAEAHAISRSHLTKIVMRLAALGWIETTRGRGGGLRLARPARELSVGAVLRATETDRALVECFEPASNTCRIDGRCRLKGALGRALDRFFTELDGVTLDDLVRPAPAGMPNLAPSGAPARPGARSGAATRPGVKSARA